MFSTNFPNNIVVLETGMLRALTATDNTTRLKMIPNIFV